MNQRKIIKFISIVLLTAFTFVSCSKGAKEISTSLLKTAEIESYTFDSSAKIHLEFPGELIGLEGPFPLDVQLTSNGSCKLNADKLPTALVNMNFDVMDLKFDTQSYIEPTSKSGEKHLEFYIKMPKFVKSSLGFGSQKEEYLKCNLNELLANISNVPLDKKFFKQLLSNQEIVLEMNKQVIDIIASLGKDDSLKDMLTYKGNQNIKRRNGSILAKTYEFNLNNYNFKPLLKSIVSDDKVLKKILELTNKYTDVSNSIDIDNVLNEISTNRDSLLEKIELLPNIFGEKGLSCTFSMSNGYIVYQKYVLDINAENTIKIQAEVENNYYDINNFLKIDKPEIDSNSINALKLLNKLGIISMEDYELAFNHWDNIKFLLPQGNSIEGTAREYFYPQEKAIYHYTDKDGNKTHSIEPQYFNSDKIQIHYKSAYYDTIFVYSFEDNAVTSVYTCNYVEETDFTSTDEKHYGKVLIYKPLQEGNFWYNPDDSVTYISSASTKITTPSGNYDAMELTTFYSDDFYYKTYYAKGVGLVKSITITDLGNELEELSFELSKIEK